MHFSFSFSLLKQHWDTPYNQLHLQVVGDYLIHTCSVALQYTKKIVIKMCFF